MTDINVGQLSEAINEKMDRDGQNVDTTSGADSVIAYQVPTAENNYTWYRLYASGWVEQGGVVSITAQLQATVINLVIEMKDTNYNLVATINSLGNSWSGEFDMHAVQTSTTTISLQHGAQVSPSNISWRVSGMSAGINQSDSSNNSSSGGSSSGSSGSGGGTPDPTPGGAGTTTK